MIYVGPYDRLPNDIKITRASVLDYAHPTDMPKVLRESGYLSEDKSCWVNNPYALDGIDARWVLVLTPSGVKPLASHPDYDRHSLKGALTTGELWSAVGEEW